MSLLKTQATQTPNEELANTLSHGLALIVAIIAIPFMLSKAATFDTRFVFSVSLFSITMVMLYLSSTLYHALPVGHLKSLFNTFDHCAIFLLIAGTYSPFSLSILQGTLGWLLFIAIWAIAFIGIFLKVRSKLSHPALSTGFYLLMSWIVIFAIKPLYQSLSSVSFTWLVVGGVAYSSGVIFFVLSDRVRYSHFVWHLFVIVGTASHYMSIYSHLNSQ